MKLGKLLVFVLVGSGVAYGGLKGYIHYKIKKQVDTLVASAAPFADIEYGSIGSSLDGAVNVDDIVVYPRGVNDSVSIEQLRLITPGLEFLLNGSESMRSGELPERMGMQFRGARFNLKGRLAQLLEQAEAGQTGRQPSADQPCALNRAFATAQYRELGLSELVFDTDFLIERGLTPSQMVMKMGYSLHGVEQANFTMALEGMGDNIMSVALATPLLKNLTVSYKPDADFGRKTLDYCAGLQGTDVPSFISQLFDNSDEFFAAQLGFVPGPGIRAALREFMESQGEVRIAAQPNSPLDMNTIHLYKPEDWPNLFGLMVTVNDIEVSDLSFRMPEQKSGAQDAETTPFKFPSLAMLDPRKNRETAATQAVAKPAQAKSRNGRPRYRTVDRKEVAQLVGKNARISTVDGKRRSGRVLSIRHGVISLELRMHGGTLSTTVPIARTRKIEVLDQG